MRPNNGSPERATLGHTRKYVEIFELLDWNPEKQYSPFLFCVITTITYVNFRVKDERQKSDRGKLVKNSDTRLRRMFILRYPVSRYERIGTKKPL